MADDGLPPEAPVITEDVWQRWVNHAGPITIRVEHSGLGTTKPSVVRQQLQRLEQANTVRDFLLAYIAAVERWEAMDIFKGINYSLLPDPAQPRGVVARVEFTEKAEKSAGITVQREDFRTTPEVRFSDNNLFGLAWEVALMAQGPTAAHRQVSLSLRSKNPPFGKWTQWMLFNRLRSSDLNSLKLQQSRGLHFGIQSFPGPFGEHYVEVGYEHRDVQPGPEGGVSPELQQDRGMSERAYLRHECTVSHWVHSPGAIFPLGWNLWIANEVSNIIRTVKHDLKADVYLPLLQGGLVSLSLHAKLGLLWAYGGVRRIRSNDRYLLDSTYVRGFRSVGPGAPDVFHPPPVKATAQELLGGNVLGAASASLNFPIPGLSLFTGHCFLNAGNLVYNEDLSQVCTKSFLGEFLHSASTSFGVGLLCRMMPLSYGRLEINASFPLRARGEVIWRPAPHVFGPFRLGVHWCNT
eukprot:GGOE01013810.1.p1 GENE.GGOE01013810.1~~GGOE01013810.1.p1  ORF type:complete len:477 (-),score=123.70 GGOE01013810.1:86-1480(-)